MQAENTRSRRADRRLKNGLAGPWWETWPLPPAGERGAPAFNEAYYDRQNELCAERSFTNRMPVVLKPRSVAPSWLVRTAAGAMPRPPSPPARALFLPDEMIFAGPSIRGGSGRQNNDPSLIEPICRGRGINITTIKNGGIVTPDPESR